MITALVLSFPFFLSLLFYTRNSSGSSSNNNYRHIERHLIEVNYNVTKEEFKEFVLIHISQKIASLEEQILKVNYRFIDQWFMIAKLTHINLNNFKYDNEQIEIQLEYQSNTLLLKLPIQYFDLIIHIQVWDTVQNSAQLFSFQFRVQDTQLEIRFKIKGINIYFLDDWFPKIKFGSFQLVVDQEIQKYQKVKKIIDWFLYQFHQTIQNIFVQQLMKSLDYDSLNVKIQSKDETKKIKNIHILDSEILLMKVELFNDDRIFLLHKTF